MKRIGIALPLLGISGGINIVLNWGVILAKAGYRVEVILPPKEIRGELPFLEERDRKLLYMVSLPEARLRRYHSVLATWWETIPWLADLHAEHYAWFMQAVEAQFYEAHSEPQARYDELAASQLNVIAIAPWLRRLAERHYNLEPKRTFCVLNPLDKSLWRPMPRVPLRRGRRPVRFLVEGPSSDPRKNIVKTVRLLEQMGLPYSWVGSIVDHSAVGPHCRRVEARVPYRRMPAVYADSDVLVKASNAEGMFGPPLEMFATGGTAVCWDVQGAEEYMADRHNCRLAPMNSWPRLAEAILELAEDPDRVRALQENALATAEAWPTWDDQAGQILATIESLAPFTRASLVRQISRIEFRGSEQRPPSGVDPQRFEERSRYIAWLESEVARRDARIAELWGEAEARGRAIEALRSEVPASAFRRALRRVGGTGRAMARLSRRLVGPRSLSSYGTRLGRAIRRSPVPLAGLSSPAEPPPAIAETSTVALQPHPSSENSLRSAA